MIFIICTITDGIAAGTYLGGGAGIIWDALVSFKTVDIANPLTVTYGVVIAVYDMMTGLFAMLTWDFPNIFVGPWEVIQWLLFGISVGIVVSLLLALRGTASA